MRKIKAVFAVLAAVVCALCLFTFNSSAADEGKWIKTWGTSATEVALNNFSGDLSENFMNFLNFLPKDVRDEILKELLGVTGTGELMNVAIRTVIKPTASGDELRVKFSNYYGKKPLVINRSKVALSDTKDTASGIDPFSMSTLKFDGKETVTIPAGEEVYSDPILFDVVAGQDIAVSTYIKDFMGIRTMGLTGGSTYIKVAGSDSSGIELIESDNFNLVYDIELDDETKWLHAVLDFFAGIFTGTGSLDVPISNGSISIVPVITDIEVLNSNDSAYSVVVVGDSTVANNFPHYLYEKIREYDITDIGISAKGLMGNPLMGEDLGYDSLVYGESLLKRMKNDILGPDGKNSANVKYVILKTGANDIIYPVCSNIKDVAQPTAEELKAGFKKVFDFCHENGIKVIVVGITPWGGYSGTQLSSSLKYDRSYEERTKDWKIALEVNEWLSTTSDHDGYIDYNEFSINPLDPPELPALHHSYTTDGLLPSDLLQREWAERFPYALIGVGTNIRIMGVGISESELTLYKGETGKLTSKVFPSAANQRVTWSSSNPSVVSVDSKGNLTARAKGEAVITVTTVDKDANGKKPSATCKVSVKIKPTSITVSGKDAVIYTTKTTKLTAKVEPSDTDFKSVVWSSSDEKVATVDQSGLVTATGKGIVYIKATSTFDSKITASYKITVKKKVQVQAIYLNYDERTRNVGTTFTLVPTMNPTNATFTDVTWISSNSKIAKVDKNGKVTALKTGTAVITCKSVDNPKVSASCIVNVTIKTKGVKLPTKKLTIYVSQTKTLKAEVLPSNATNKKVTWTSSNKSVATVSKSGKITAKKPGKATITVKTKNGGYKATCTVTVKRFVAVKSFKLNKTSLSINDGKSYTLKAVFSPSNASNRDVVWKSSNTDIATVSSKGVVKAVKPGTVTISCKSKETGKTLKCKVKVKKVKVKKVLFGEKTYIVNHNDKLQLKALISPANATNKKVKWESSHPEFVKVSSKGKVTALKLGKVATITATSVDGKHIATCRVKVAKVNLEGLKLNKTSASAYTGGTITLTPIFTPKKPSDSKVTWTSSDTKLATVSADGVVTALKEGSVVITCTASDGGFKASCTVKIAKGIRVTGVKLDKTSEEANVGAAFNLFATVEPADATNKKLIWTSTNPAVATVSANGRVVTLKQGLTYIQVRTEDGRKVASCRINVVP